MKKVRQVYIERVMDSWLVKYVHRTYGQRYTAGQFCAKKNLELVEEIEEKKTSDRSFTRRVNKAVKKLYQGGEFDDL